MIHWEKILYVCMYIHCYIVSFFIVYTVILYGILCTYTLYVTAFSKIYMVSITVSRIRYYTSFFYYLLWYLHASYFTVFYTYTLPHTVVLLICTWSYITVSSRYTLLCFIIHTIVRYGVHVYVHHYIVYKLHTVCIYHTLLFNMLR